jgi:hypothetical protein
MVTPSMIFYLFAFTFLAALAFAGFQVFRTERSQRKHDDDRYALTHRLQREQAKVEAARAGAAPR